MAKTVVDRTAYTFWCFMSRQILGIDYGTKNFGIAVSQGNLSEALTQINRREAIPRLKKIVTDLAIDLVVIGLPSGRLRKNVQEFGSQISHELKLEVIYWDETLSSNQARSILRGKSRKKIQKREHKMAAAIILESFLSANKI